MHARIYVEFRMIGPYSHMWCHVDACSAISDGHKRVGLFVLIIGAEIQYLYQRKILMYMYAWRDHGSYVHNAGSTLHAWSLLE